MSDDKDVFSTRDITLAATLIMLKFDLIKIDYQVEGSRQVGYFNFSNSEDTRDAEKKFWASKLAVEPRGFASTIRSLKAQVNGIYKNPHSHFNE